MVDAYQLFNCLSKRTPNERSHFIFLQQQIPCFALLPDSTVKMVFALIKALCATVKITAKTTAMKKAVKPLKVGTGVLFSSAILYQLNTEQAQQKIFYWLALCWLALQIVRVKCVGSVHMHTLHSQCSEEWHLFQVSKTTHCKKCL